MAPSKSAENKAKDCIRAMLCYKKNYASASQKNSVIFFIFYKMSDEYVLFILPFILPYQLPNITILMPKTDALVTQLPKKDDYVFEFIYVYF